ADLVRRNRSTLDATLNALHSDLAVIDRHQLDLAATVKYLNQAVQGYSSVGYTQGTSNRWANIFVQSLGPLGVDALLGPCGAVDKLIDQLLGTKCDDKGKGKGPGGIGIPLPTPSIPVPVPTGPLPTPTVPIATPSLP